MRSIRGKKLKRRKLLITVFAVFLFFGNKEAFPDKGIFSHLEKEAAFPLHLDTESGLILAGVAAGTAACLLLDDKVKEGMRSLNSPVLDSLQNMDVFGDGFFTLGMSGGFYLLGGEKEKKVCCLLLESLIETGLITTVLKAGFGRKRPDSGFGPGAFSPFTLSNDSFPSGHAATAFSSAAVLARAYDAGWITYPLAACVSFFRIYKEKHWLSDVFLGSVIGLAIGNMHVLDKDSKASELSFGFETAGRVTEVDGSGLFYVMKLKF